MVISAMKTLADKVHSAPAALVYDDVDFTAEDIYAGLNSNTINI